MKKKKSRLTSSISSITQTKTCPTATISLARMSVLLPPNAATVNTQTPKVKTTVAVFNLLKSLDHPVLVVLLLSSSSPQPPSLVSCLVLLPLWFSWLLVFTTVAARRSKIKVFTFFCFQNKIKKINKTTNYPPSLKKIFFCIFELVLCRTGAHLSLKK